jgi:enolase
LLTFLPQRDRHRFVRALASKGEGGEPMSKIQTLRAFEVLDARGVPTLATEVETEDGHRGVAVVPVGELRCLHHASHLVDHEPDRFQGQGQRLAVQNVEGVLAPALRGQSVLDQRRIDQTLCALGGTSPKERLGGNATLAVSLAVARAAARVARAPLHQYLSTYLGTAPAIPLPLINLISGGVRAHNRLEFERVMICPVGAP